MYPKLHPVKTMTQRKNRTSPRQEMTILTTLLIIGIPDRQSSLLPDSFTTMPGCECISCLQLGTEAISRQADTQRHKHSTQKLFREGAHYTKFKLC